VSSCAFSDFGDPEFAAEFARRRGGRAERVAGRIVELAGIREGDRVVDLCCGPGLVAAHLAERVGAAGEVIGIDSSPAMISLARGAARGRNVRFLEGDAYSFSSLLSQPVDHVVATSAWQNFLTDPARVLDELARALKPRGRFSFDVRLRSEGSRTAPSRGVIARSLAARWPELVLPDGLSGPPRRPYTSEELDRDLSLILRRGFRLLRREEVEEPGGRSWREQRGWRFDWWLRRTAPALPAQARAEILSELERKLASQQGTTAPTRRTTYVVVEAAP
jgi:SAM-dependent methyltransferase